MVVGIYARVSTRGKHQDLETQLLPLRAYASKRGWEIREFTDEGISGSKSSRPGLDKLMAAARSRKIDGVVVARFDRFARSTRHLVTALEEFQALGVEFVSLNESIDTSTPMGKMIYTVLAAMAELERGIIQERIHAGLDRARKQGKVLGRKRLIVSKDRVESMRAEGLSYPKIAKRLGVSVGKAYAVANSRTAA